MCCRADTDNRGFGVSGTHSVIRSKMSLCIQVHASKGKESTLLIWPIYSIESITHFFPYYLCPNQLCPISPCMSQLLFRPIITALLNLCIQRNEPVFYLSNFEI